MWTNSSVGRGLETSCSSWTQQTNVSRTHHLVIWSVSNKQTKKFCSIVIFYIITTSLLCEKVNFDNHNIHRQIWNIFYPSKHIFIFRKFPCDKCNYFTTNQYNLKIHKQSVHEKAKFPCPNCTYVSGYFDLAVFRT